MKKIRIFDLKFKEKYIKYFQKKSNQIFKDGFFTANKYSNLFEKKFSKKYNFRYSLASSSGTSALEIIFRSLEIKNKVVLIASNTFIATAHAAKNAGGKLDFVDLEPEHYGMCPDDLRNKIKRHRGKIGAVVVIHIGGLITPKIDEIVKICKSHKIPLVEDAAQAQGSKINNKYAGSFGLAGAFSFFTTKVMTTGEGGMIVSNSKKFIKRCISNRQFGFDLKNKSKHISISGNYKFNEFAALLGIVELSRVNERIKKRNLIAKRYASNLKNNKFLKVITVKGKNFCNHYKLIIMPKCHRYQIENILKKNRISVTGGVYYIPLHRQPIYQNINKKKLPISDIFCNKHVCLPCYPELSLKDVDYICHVLNRNLS